MKNWLEGIFEAFEPHVWLRVTVALVMAVVILTGSWPGNTAAGYGDEIWPAAYVLLAVWGVVEFIHWRIRED